MKGRIQTTFQRLGREKKKALIPYIMAGDPSLSTTQDLVMALERCGADIIELGVPFSDPLADGPVIQKAAERALRQKTSLRAILKMVRSLRRQTQIPLVLMTYYNPIHRYGERRFSEHAAAAGVDGVIIPDLPPEEGKSLIQAARANGLATIFLLAPTSTRDRIRRVSQQSQGFIYYVSITGITGAPLKSMQDVRTRVQAIRRVSKKPVAVGFGISTPEQAARVARWADGVIVGSAIVKRIEAHGSEPGLVQRISKYVQTLHRAVRNPTALSRSK